jgi:hypothetical protein
VKVEMEGVFVANTGEKPVTMDDLRLFSAA